MPIRRRTSINTAINPRTSQAVVRLRDSRYSAVPPIFSTAMEAIKMHSPAFPSFQEKYKGFNNPGPGHVSPSGFFRTHPIAEIIRGLFFSSILWMLLAITLYGVYSIVVG
jgi:hypothetical protein